MGKFLFAFLIYSLCLSGGLEAGQQAVVTVVATPPEEGTVSGSGTYDIDRTVFINAEAHHGWYVADVLYSGAPAGSGGCLCSGLLPDKEFDSRVDELLDEEKTITTFRMEYSAGGDGKTTVLFKTLAPQIAIQPTNITADPGTAVTLTGIAIGGNPISYQWLKDGVAIPGANSTDLRLPSVHNSDKGMYSLVASNEFGVTHTSPATLSISNFAISVNSGEKLPSGDITGLASVSVSIDSVFGFSKLFYTVDGSPPDFTSLPYRQGFLVVDKSATVRLISYSDDLSQFVTHSFQVILPESYYFSKGGDGGGEVTVTPVAPYNGFSYPANSTVTVVAKPFDGFTFMGWQGDLTGSDLTNTVIVDRDKNVFGTFGRPIVKSVLGRGRIRQTPDSPLSPANSTVRFDAIPDPGFYFGLWGGIANGGFTPLSLQVPRTLENVSALFSALPPNQVALTILTEGGGRIEGSNLANKYAIGQTVTITAVPDYGQSFLGWTGDSEGLTNSIAIVMDTSKVITANFSRTAFLWMEEKGRDVIPIIFTGVRGEIYSLQKSTDLSVWETFSNVTNFYEGFRFSPPVVKTVPIQAYRAVAQ